MSTCRLTDTSLDRRRILFGSIAVSSLAAIAGGLLARGAQATPEAARELLGKLVSEEPRFGKINLQTPEIADGTAVPVIISVESPMTETDHVKAIHVLAEGNPNPGVATFHLTPPLGRAEVHLRMRLAQSQKIIAVADMSDGSVWMAGRAVTVTVAGCA
jgi:sulfur-oxidizing protein SoxY